MAASPAPADELDPRDAASHPEPAPLTTVAVAAHNRRMRRSNRRLSAAHLRMNE